MTHESSTHPDRLVVYPSRAKLFLILMGAIGFVVLGIWIGTSRAARGIPIWDVLIATYIGVPFFGACGLYAAYRLVSNRPALEIDWMGITDSASALGAGHLNWDEVDHVVLCKFYGKAMLGIVPRELDLFLSRQHPIRRYLAKLNLSWGLAPILIPQVTLPMTVVELADLLRTRYGVRVESDA